MANILVKIEGVPGESTERATGYDDLLEAVAISDQIVAAAGSASKAKVSDICLTRMRDKGSPLLAQHCSTGKDLGDVFIYLFRNVGEGERIFMKYTLANAYVSRIEFDTADSSGIAYLPHDGGAASEVNAALLLKGGGGDPGRLAAFASDGSSTGGNTLPSPIYNEPPGAATNTELERLWLHPARVEWSYTPFVGAAPQGAVVGGWNLLGSIQWTAPA